MHRSEELEKKILDALQVCIDTLESFKIKLQENEMKEENDWRGWRETLPDGERGNALPYEDRHIRQCIDELAKMKLSLKIIHKITPEKLLTDLRNHTGLFYKYIDPKKKIEYETLIGLVAPFDKEADKLKSEHKDQGLSI